MNINETSPRLTLERVLELWSYNQETGLFTRAVTRGGAKQGTVARANDCYGYIQIKIDNKSYRAHRLAWFIVKGNWPNYDIDHINGIRDDNRIVNLRDVTTSVNMQNQCRARSGNRSGMLGVSWHKHHKKFAASIMLSGKLKHLGYFTTPEEAHSTYISAKRRLHDGNTL